MSIAAMNVAWKYKLDPSNKIVLLALADWASDEGLNIFPSVGKLAEKTCLSVRQVQRVLRKLEDLGLIRKTGWHLLGGRSDRATVEYAMRMEPGRGDNMTPRENGRGDIQGTENGLRGDIQGENGVTPMSPYPSERDPVERDPSTVSSVVGKPPLQEKDQEQETINADELMESWNDFAEQEGLPAVMALSGSRRQKIAARLREHPDLKFWQAVFDEMNDSPFLLGKRKRKEGDSNWRVTFDWLIANDTNALKVAEGRY